MAPEWTENTLADFRAFRDGHRNVADPIERALLNISDALTSTWTGRRCLACPLAETAALAAATLQLYRENQRK